MAAWAPIADLPEVGDTWSVCAHAGKVYLTLGRTPTYGAGYPWILEYDPVADTYTQKAECPHPCSYGSFAYWDGVFYLIGGDDVDDNSTRVLGYDIATDTWFECAALPYKSEDGAAIAIAGGAGGKIVVTGGYDDTTLHGHTQVYDIATDTWSVGTDWPGVIGYHAMVPGATSGTVQTIGGYGNLTGPDDPRDDMIVVYEYTLATSTWAHVGDVSLPIDGPAFTQVGTDAYLVSGTYIPDADYVPTVQVWGIASHAPQHDTDYPSGIWAAAATAIGTTIFVFGGYATGPGETAGAYKLATDPQPGWPSSPVPSETPGDSAYRPLLIPDPGGSSDVSGTLDATTVGATSRGYDPYATFGYGSSIWIKFPRLPEGAFVHVTVHGGAFGASWFAALYRVTPGNFFGSSSGGNQLAGATVELDNTFIPSDGTYDYLLVVVSQTTDEHAFTVDWRHAIPLSAPHNDGKYSLAVPERRKRHPWYTKPRWAQGRGTSSYPTYPGNPNAYDVTMRPAPYGPNDAMIITNEHIGAGVRHVHFTADAVTVGPPTLLRPVTDDGGGIYHSDFLGNDGIAAMITNRIEGEPEFWIYGLDAATQAFDVAPGPVGLYNSNAIWTVRLSATRGLFFCDASQTGIGPYISSGIIGIVDFDGVTPTITSISLDEALGSPTPSTQSTSVFTFTWATRLTDTTALVLFRYYEYTGPDFPFYTERRRAGVLTISGSTATFGPLTELDPIENIDPENWGIGYYGLFNSFRSATPGRVDAPVRHFDDSIDLAVFTIAGGAVSISFEPVPIHPFIIIGWPMDLGGGLGWALVDPRSSIPNTLLAPVSRFSQSGVRYPLQSVEDPDVSIDIENAILIGGSPYGDNNSEYSLNPVYMVRPTLVGDLVLNTNFGTDVVTCIQIPPEPAGPRDAQHATIIEVDPTIPDPSGFAMAAYTPIYEFTGEADSGPALFMGDAHRSDHDAWRALDGSTLPVLFHEGYRTVDFLGVPPYIPDQDLDIRVRWVGTGAPAVIGVERPADTYFVDAGDVTTFVAHCMFLLSWAFDGTDQPVREARASITFANSFNEDITTVHGPWLVLPFFDAGFRPIKVKAAAPTGTVTAGFTVEMRHGDGTPFTSTDDQLVVSSPDFWVGADKLVDFGDNGLVKLGDALIAAGPSAPGGPTQMHVLGGDAFGPRADHHALTAGVDDGTIWAAAWLGAPTYEYRIRQYSHLGALLRDFPSPHGMPVQLAPTDGWLYYTVGTMNVYGIHLATGTDVIVIDSAYNHDHLDNDNIAGLAVLKQPTGDAPAPDDPAMPLLPDGIRLLTGRQDTFHITEPGVDTTPADILRFAASAMVPGTVHAESERSFVYLARGSLSGYDHGIARMWTDGITWMEDPVVTFLTPARGAAVALVPSRVVHVLAAQGVTATLHRGRQVKTANVNVGRMRPNHRVSTGGDLVRVAWEVTGRVYENGPDATPIDITGHLVKAVLTADIAGTTDTTITVTRDGTTVGTAMLPAGETEWETPFGTITWASGQDVDFTLAPGMGLEGLIVELDWSWS